MENKKIFFHCREIFFDFFLPKFCLLCSKSGKLVCHKCAKSLPCASLKCIVCSRKNPLGLTCKACRKKYEANISLSTFAYQSRAKELIHAFKYEDVTELKYFFAREVIKTIKSIPNYNEFYIQPIPVSLQKQRRRGYNQSLLIARILADQLKVSLTDSLTRVDVSKSQVAQAGKIDRKLNVKGAFKLKNKPPRKIILFDDVITSGATMREASKILFRCGAKEIICISIAR